MSRFVEKMGTTRIELSGGDWLEVREELSNLEERKAFVAVTKRAEMGKTVELDLEQVGRAKILAWVTAWGGPGFVDGTTQVATLFSAAALDHVKGRDYKEILDAVEAHEKAFSDAQESEKNGKAGESNSGPILPFVATSAAGR